MILPENWSFDYDGWILLVVMLVGASCAIPGSFLLVRRQSMTGDAISHAILPGIVLGFLFSGTRDWHWMFIGAAAAGVASTVISQLLQSIGKVERGAALGVVFTAFFALGLLLIRQAADHVDLDPLCVLFGEVEIVPLDTVEIMGIHVPHAVLVLMGMFLIGAAITLLFWKELLITSFDPAVADSQGISSFWLQQVLMMMVAMTCVAAFEAVGTILVIAMLVGPPATARLLTERFRVMLPLAIVLGALVAAIGQVLAISVPTSQVLGVEDVSIAGMTAVLCGAMVVVAAVTAPRTGMISRWLNRCRIRLKIIQEDLLADLYRRDIEGRDVEIAEVAGMSAWARHPWSLDSWLKPMAIHRLVRTGCLVGSRPLLLTSEGVRMAERVIRIHRLWEGYLAGHVSMPLDHLHLAAMELEHVTTPEIEQALDAYTGISELDPHGREIPPVSKSVHERQATADE